MPVLTQLATSTMYFWQQVEAALINGTVINPTSDVVQMAAVPVPTFGPPPDPTPGQLNPAIWGTGPGPTYWAGILIGPANGGLVLAIGSYVIAVKVTDSPEVPVLWGWGLQIV